MLTDRSPKASTDPDKRVFPRPRFTPQIGRFRLEGDKLVPVEVIEIKNAQGRKITGHPNPSEGTWRSRWTSGRELGTDPDGLDSGTRQKLPDGTFWIPTSTGRGSFTSTQRGGRSSASAPLAVEALPRVLALRRPNAAWSHWRLRPTGHARQIMQNPV
jgi:hypothetical protein